MKDKSHIRLALCLAELGMVTDHPLILRFMDYRKIIADNEKKVRATVLTDEEKEAALFEGQKKKYFKLKHGHLWNVPIAEVSKLNQTDIAPPSTLNSGRQKG